MLTNILIALACLIGLFFLYASTRPADFRITRTARITAPAAAIFANINDLHAWDAWSPWAKLDPAAKNEHSGPAAGPGASFAWSGNSKVGVGKMTITESVPNERVALRLDFEKPMKATNRAEFVLRPVGPETEVEWTMTGINGLMSKAFGLVVDCDRMVGGQFEQGLASLKSISEARAR